MNAAQILLLVPEAMMVAMLLVCCTSMTLIYRTTREFWGFSHPCGTLALSRIVCFVMYLMSPDTAVGWKTFAALQSGFVLCLDLFRYSLVVVSLHNKNHHGVVVGAIFLTFAVPCVSFLVTSAETCSVLDGCPWNNIGVTLIAVMITMDMAVGSFTVTQMLNPT